MWMVAAPGVPWMEQALQQGITELHRYKASHLQCLIKIYDSLIYSSISILLTEQPFPLSFCLHFLFIVTGRSVFYKVYRIRFEGSGAKNTHGFKEGSWLKLS